MKIKETNKKGKKGFTMVEILVAVVILSVLSVVVIGIIIHYIDKGKYEYDNALEKQFLLAGKEYYTNYPNKLPKKGEKTIVSLAELKSLNIVKNDFVDSENNVCSNPDSLVMITNNGQKKYTYKACLVCSGSSRFFDNEGCTNSSDEIEIITPPDKICEIVNNNGKYTVYDKNGESNEYTSGPFAVKGYIDAGCSYVKKTCEPGNIFGIDFYYGENDQIYANAEEAKDKGECLPLPPPTTCSSWNYSITPSYYKLSSCTSDYKCAMNTNDFSNTQNLINGLLNVGVETNISNAKTYYSYYLKNSVLEALKAKDKSVSSAPSYSSSGTNAKVTQYFKDVRKKRSTLLKSSYSYVHQNKPIPAEYSFLIGSSSKKAKITNPYKMKWADVKKWKSYSNYDKAVRDEVSLAKKEAKGKYKARYYNVGTYNGTKVDVVMTLDSFGGCKLSPGASKCGLWFGNKKLEVYSLGVNKITVKYNFYKAGTNTPIYVKGYTTYWDIDAHQGIHFVQNTTGLYVYNGNATYISSVNGAPYIYDYSDKKYSGYNGAGAVSETFAGTYMKKTFTFMSGKETNYSKITSSAGHVSHSTIPIGISMSYYSDTNASSVLNNNSTVKYIVRFSNPTASSKSVKVTVNTGNMKYVSGSAKFSDGTIKNPSKSGNTLTWTKTVSALKTDYVIFTLQVTGDSVCGDVVSPSAKSVVGSTTYNAPSLTNPVICQKQQQINSTCIEYSS